MIKTRRITQYRVFCAVCECSPTVSEWRDNFISAHVDADVAGWEYDFKSNVWRCIPCAAKYHQARKKFNGLEALLGAGGGV